ncbi:MAG: hypothetical protein CL607_19595 [Anaerolineaceae bacterium]|nr:hypothetical protein [Anaerolineaceae bacterium]
MKSLKSWWSIASLLLIILSFATYDVPAVEAQGYYDMPLTLYQSYPGNTAVVSGGISFFPQLTSNSFTINVPTCNAGPATIRGVFLKWYNRWRSRPGDFTTTPTWDDTLDVQINGSGYQPITADDLYTARHDGTVNRVYHRGYQVAEITSYFATNYTPGGTTTLDIQNFNLPPEPANNTENYGVGITVIYECAEFPYAETNYFSGLDWWYFMDPPGMSEYSDALCTTFASVAYARYAEVNGVFGGQANATAPFRGHVLHYLTGSGTPPTEPDPQQPIGVVVNNANSENFPPNSIWVSSLGQEWDLIEQPNTIVVDPGDTYVCIQGHSTPSSGVPQNQVGMSGDLLGTVLRIYPQQNQTPTPDTPTPTNTPTNTPTSTPTLPPGVTPTDTPTPPPGVTSTPGIRTTPQAGIQPTPMPTFVPVTELPQTGETPLMRQAIVTLGLLIAGLSILGLGGFALRHRLRR